MQRVAALLPVIELADDADVVGVRGPYGKVGARPALLFQEMRAELIVEAKVAAFVEKIKIVVGEQVWGLAGQWLTSHSFDTRLTFLKNRAARACVESPRWN